MIKEIDFKPVDKFVVTFDDFRTYKGPFTIVDKKASTEENTVTKVVKKNVKYNHQVATVVATPELEADQKSPIEVGDKILVDFRACMPLDGYENLFMIPRYNVLGVLYSEEVFDHSDGSEGIYEVNEK